MDGPTYRVIEITGTSTEGVTQAIESGVARADRTLRNLDWIEVMNIRGRIEQGQVAQYQVTMKVGFRMEEPFDEESRPADTSSAAPPHGPAADITTP